MENQNPKKTRWNKYLMGMGIAVMTLVTTYLVHTNPALNMADLTKVGPTGTLTDALYMPSYTGGIGESGLIEVKTKQNLPTFNSITFSLKYSPVNALMFENNPIIFDANTEFQDAAFQMTASPEAGKLIVTIILKTPITVGPGILPGTEATHKTLFKLNTQLNPALPVGQIVNITFEDLALLNGTFPLTTIPNMPATTITVQGQNELKVLNAQAIDSTHVALQFSDYLSNIGNTVAYTFTPALVPSLVEPGTNYGYDQKYVVLTTAAQTAGQEYSITVDPLSAISSNQQGKINNVFSNVLFYGFGKAAGVLSDFGMQSATVTGYNSIAVTFNSPVKAASVTKTDFALAIHGGAPVVTIDNVSSVSGATVNLTVSTPLLKDNTYLLSAVTPASILRDSDGAGLGVDRVAFAGAKSGPRLIGATVTDAGAGIGRLQLTFDEPIKFPTPPIANNPVGWLYNTGGLGIDLIDDTKLISYPHSITGSTLTIDNAVFIDPAKNFTFAVSAPGYLVNSQGVPVDDAYKAISFWGLGHNNSTNSVGAVTVTKKDAFKIAKGSLTSSVSLSDVTVFYESGPATLVNQPVFSVTSVGTDLEVVMTPPFSFSPDRHYVVRIADHSVPTTTLAAKDFAVTRELNITSAQAISASTARVTFSENIDERDVVMGDFTINDVPVTAMVIDSGYQSVVLTSGAPLAPGSVNKAALTVGGIGHVYSNDGNASLTKAGYFTGYQTQSSQSAVSLSSIEVKDAQTIRMNFNGALDESSFTPVNLQVTWLTSPIIRHPLTVTGITKIDADTYELKTSIQDAGMNYFVIFNGVKDSTGLRLGNAKVNNFFGFKIPVASVSLVTPNTVTNDLDSNIVLSGTNLDIVKEVRMGNKVMTIITQTATSITVAVPAGSEPLQYNITLIDKANNSIVFKNALLVTLPVQGLKIRSEQSQAIPLNVPNDGTTKTKLWVLVEDPVSLASVSSVVVNLSQIGGPSTVEMIKDAGTQPQFSQWYTYETKVPVTVPTKDAPYLLPVEVRKGSEKYTGTVSIRVSKDVLKGVAPVIDNVYVSPISVSPDGTTPVKISAQVTDQDGAVTINSVVADLGSLGLGFKPLVALSEVTAGTELETQFFQSEEFTVPKTTQLGDYVINVIASDVTGEKVTATLHLQVSTLVTGPKIDPEVSYISPRKSIPRDGKTTFDINVFVSDPDGVGDIQTVTANFPSLGLAPVALTKDAAAATEGKSAWFKATGLTVSKIAPLGSHDIEVRATDKQGGMSNLILRIEVTHKDTLGEPPRVVDDRGYSTPRVAINDGQTPVTLYAFVQDDDGDVESVLANLSEIGQVGAETGGTMGSATKAAATPAATPAVPSNGSCPTGSNVLVCMNPSVKEGSNGQWFILPDVTISKLTTASPNPYQVSVTVTDSGGKTASGTIPVYVGSGDSISEQQEPPKALAAVPTSETSIEVLFSKEMSANSISSSGKGFRITSESNVNETLAIVGATINPAGTVVILSTANQVPGKRYVLSVTKDVKDIVGRGVIEGAASRLNFSGFQLLNKAPILEYIQATDVNMVELEFRDNLKPTSVRSGMSQTDASAQYGVSIYESEDTTQKLDVLGVSLQSPGNVIRIKTGPQKSDQKYRITIDGLAAADGTALPVAINKGFKGYNLTIVQHKAAAGMADLNGDGKVDFTDFTIFSSVYGTVYLGQGQNLATTSASAAAKAAAAQAATAKAAGQPLTPDPSATVPITSPAPATTTTTTTTTQTPK